MAQNPRILVVDDEIPVCKSVVSALEGEGYDVIMALSGEECLEKDEDMKPDIIIADLMMPGMSGMDLLKIVKNRRPSVSFIMITGYPSVKTAVQAVKLGAFDYLPKPFTPNELRSLVSRARQRILLDSTEKTAIPPDLHCIPENSWARVEEDGLVRIGVHHLLLRSIRGVMSIELPEDGEIRHQGEVCARITDASRKIHRVWSPITGTIVISNIQLKRDISVLEEDPYGKGWILLLDPAHLEKDKQKLVATQKQSNKG